MGMLFIPQELLRFCVGMRLQIAFLFPKLTQKEKMLLMEEKLKELRKQQVPPN